MFHHIIDTSGTGWSTNSTAEQIDRMNQARVGAGLPAVKPVNALPEIFPTDMDRALFEGAIAAGDHVYLVNLAEPGAVLAVAAAGLDHDGIAAGSVHAAAVRWVQLHDEIDLVMDKGAALSPTGSALARFFNDIVRFQGTGRGKTDVTGILTKMIEEEQADRNRYDFTMFAWTDRDGSLQSGDLRGLARDLERRHNADQADVAFIYVLGAGAELVRVDWDVSVVSYGDYADAAVTITLPDGNTVSAGFTLDGRRQP